MICGAFAAASASDERIGDGSERSDGGMRYHVPEPENGFCSRRRLYDGLAQRQAEKAYIEFNLPEGKTAQYLYICFADMPDSWAIEEKTDGKWQTVAEGSRDYDHALVELGGKSHFRLVEDSGVTTRLKINEVFVFGEGELPDWVQRWEPTPEKADLLVLAAHPDDELIFFGGTIPTYAAEQEDERCRGIYDLCERGTQSELLNGLWHMGLRTYPSSETSAIRIPGSE